MNDRPRYESSIVIPVFNKWELTRQCLKSLAATTNRERVEVIVVDNASSDITPIDCPVLGQSLFGASFRYLRNEQNRNFAGASNQGALAAHGQYLIFLNNDTEALPGWYEPLMDDFSRHEKIAATGPVLLYPPDDVFGHTVQHLGVTLTPFYRLGHLHKLIPATSPLVSRRRFFQAITGACMATPRLLFMDIGMFDERFINGFEDMELCARFGRDGWRMTINPESRLVHYESSSAGRYDSMDHNAKLLRQLAPSWPLPDCHKFFEDDGLGMKITDGLRFIATDSPVVCHKLGRQAARASREQILEMLASHPYWENGMLLLAERTEDYSTRMKILMNAFRIYDNPDILLEAWRLALDHGDKKNATMSRLLLDDLTGNSDNCLKEVWDGYIWFRKLKMPELADPFRAWLDRYPEIEKKHAQLAEKICELEKRMNARS